MPLWDLVKSYNWLSRLGRRKAATFFTLLLIVLEAGYLAVMAVSHDTMLESLNPDTKITSHRGGALRAPENTLSALNYTWECGADYAEIDIQENKRTVVSNIQDDGGTPPAEAGAYIADLIQRILQEKKSGVELIL